MAVELNVLDHLGIDFNSNIAAVLTEAIANAWDADAENVELRQVERKMKLLELQEQGQTYVDKLKKILLAQGDATSNIEVVFVLGEPIDEEGSNPERLKSSMAAISPGSRIVHYDSLIRGAQEAHSEFLKKSEQLDKLERIVDRI